MNRNRYVISLFLLAATGAASPSATSAQTELGLYPAGAVGQMKVGVLPPPGVVLENGTLAFFSTRFVDGDGNVTDRDGAAVANRTVVMWTTDLELFGGQFAVAAAVPLTNFAAPLPAPGGEASVGIGDVYLQPATLGWHGESVHVTARYGVFAPTGRFEPGSNTNIGRGFWSHLLTLGATSFSSSDRPWHLTLQGRYEIPMTIEGSDVRPGQALIFEYGIGKALTSRLDLGLVGFGVTQTTDVQGDEFQGDPTRYRYWGAGPEIQATLVNRATWKLVLSIRSYFDFAVRNAPESNSTVFSFAFAL